jgi:phage tail-like protein
MAETAERSDPWPAFRFEIRLDDMPPAGFSECSGLQLEVEVQEYHEGGFNTSMRKRPGHTKQQNITLKRGIVDRKMWDWFYDVTQGKVKRRNGSITVRDQSGRKVVMEWAFKLAFPMKWVGPDLNASQNNLAVETIELAYEGLERTDRS